MLFNPARRRSFRSPVESLECRRLLAAAGDLDTSFSGDGRVYAPDSRLTRAAMDVEIVAGNKTLVAGVAEGKLMVARYNTNGTPDTTFGPSTDGRVLVNNAGAARTMDVRSDGKIVLATSFSDGPDIMPQLVRLNANGTVDTGFGGGDGIVDIVPPFVAGVASPNDLVVLPNNKIVVAIINQNEMVAARFNSDGSPDTTFGGGDGFALADAGFGEGSLAIAVAPDGSVFVGGSSESDHTNSTSRSVLVKFKPDGSGVDTNFGGGDGILLATLARPGDPFSSGSNLAFTAGGKLLF